jgi:hypothetical protein
MPLGALPEVFGYQQLSQIDFLSAWQYRASVHILSATSTSYSQRYLCLCTISSARKVPSQ